MRFSLTGRVEMGQVYNWFRPGRAPNRTRKTANRKSHEARAFKVLDRKILSRTRIFARERERERESKAWQIGHFCRFTRVERKKALNASTRYFFTWPLFGPLRAFLGKSRSNARPICKIFASKRCISSPPLWISSNFIDTRRKFSPCSRICVKSMSNIKLYRDEIGANGVTWFSN